MSGGIPQHFLNELRDRSDIVDIISSRMAVKKAGTRFKALCPFHDEKSPSFSINPDRQFFYCFGCGAHGDAIEFVMRYDHLDFRDTVSLLAAQAGLEVPTEEGSQEARINPELYSAMSDAASFYQSQLKGNERAITYLKKRGLDGHTAKRYGIGFAKEAWHNLEALNSYTARKPLLIETGMLINKDNNCYDRFRDRIMFPIRDTRGRVIAFGGRILDKGEPKYLNSPETPIFHKGNELYGLYEALQHHKALDKVVIVEGYMDVIALAQHDIPYAVATLGTATSSKHLQKLFRYTQTVIFCFDGDKAGFKAAAKALSVNLALLRDGLHIRFCFLPEGEDPDSYVRQIGTTAFEKMLHQSMELPDFFFKYFDDNHSRQTISDKADYAKAAQSLINTMPTGLFKQLMFQRLADHLSIALSDLTDLPAPKSPRETEPVISATIKPLKTPLAPTQLISSLLLQQPQLLKHVDTLSILSNPAHDFDSKVLQMILRFYQKQPQGGLNSLFDQIDREDIKNHLAQLAAWEFNFPESGIEAELIGALERTQAISHKQKIAQLIEKSKQSGLSTEERQLLQQLLTQKS